MCIIKIKKINKSKRKLKNKFIERKRKETKINIEFINK